MREGYNRKACRWQTCLGCFVMADEKLNDVALLKKDLYKKIKSKTSLTINEVSNLVESSLYKSKMLDWGERARIVVGASEYKTTSSELHYDMLSSVGFKKALRQATNGAVNIVNMSGTTAIQASVKAYTDAVNTAYLKSVTGNITIQEGVQQAIAEMAKKGLKVVDNPSAITGSEMLKKKGEIYTTYQGKDGKIRMYPLDSAIRRDLVTSINRACGAMTLEDCKELNTELVETSWHVGARPEHEQWQGKVFSLNPDNKKYPYFYDSQEAGGTGYGEMLGLCGINCYHRSAPFSRVLNVAPLSTNPPKKRT